MHGMHNGDYTQAAPRFLFVHANSEFKPEFESLVIPKKKNKKGFFFFLKKAFLHCAALQSTAALCYCRGSDSNGEDGYIESVCVLRSGRAFWVIETPCPL